MLSSLTIQALTPPQALDIFESSDEFILGTEDVADGKQQQQRMKQKNQSCKSNNARHKESKSSSPITTKSHFNHNFNHYKHGNSWVNSISSKLASSLNLSSSWSSSLYNQNSCCNSTKFNSSANGMSNLVNYDRSIDLLKINPEDVASQLTLIDLPIFQKITKDELLSISWNTNKKHTITPNIVKFTRRFNQISFWVVEQVLNSSSKSQQQFSQQEVSPGYQSGPLLTSSLNCAGNQTNPVGGNGYEYKLKRKLKNKITRNLSTTSLNLIHSSSSAEVDAAKVRSEVVSYFIKVAKKLFDLNNLHSSYAVVCALSSTPIYRLSKTWSFVSKRDKVTLDKLSTLYNDECNFELLRNHLTNSSLPCIPYLGMYLRDLVYVDIAHPDKRRSGKVSKVANDDINIGTLGTTRFSRSFIKKFSHSDEFEAEDKVTEVNPVPNDDKQEKESLRDLKFNSIINQIEYFQVNSLYDDLLIIPSIRDYLSSARYIEELQKFLEEDNYKLSLKLEPNVVDNRDNVSDETDLKVPKNKSTFYISSNDYGNDVNKGNSMPKSTTTEAMKCFKPGHRKARSLDAGPQFRPLSTINADIDVDRRVSVDPSAVLPSGVITRSAVDDPGWTFVDNVKKSLIDDTIIDETSFKPHFGERKGSFKQFVSTRKGSVDGSFINVAFMKSPTKTTTEDVSTSTFYVENEETSSYPKLIEPQIGFHNLNYSKEQQCINQSIKSSDCHEYCPLGGDCTNEDNCNKFRERTSAISMYQSSKVSSVATFSGVMRRRTLIKHGKRCSLPIWIRYFVELKGFLMIYYPCHSLIRSKMKCDQKMEQRSSQAVENVLRNVSTNFYVDCHEESSVDDDDNVQVTKFKLNKSHFDTNQCKKLSLISGWNVSRRCSSSSCEDDTSSNKFTLSDQHNKNVYQFEVDDVNEYNDWIHHLKSLNQKLKHPETEGNHHHRRVPMKTVSYYPSSKVHESSNSSIKF